MTRVLDLFCKAGGASKGYVDAGYDVVGVDIEPQPNYPFEFVEADAMTFDLDGFDVVHASPPCHDHSTVTGPSRKQRGQHGTGWMLYETVRRLHQHGGVWVVENVEGADFGPVAHLGHQFRLCGSSFGLDLRRHRKFIASVPIWAPKCNHSWQTPRFRSLALANHRAGKLATVVGVHGHLNYAGEREIREQAMQIDWMSVDELTQALPPRYTEHIGKQLAPLAKGPR